MTFKELVGKLTSATIWGNLLAMVLVVLLLIFALWKWLDVYTKHGDEVIVPKVEGMLFPDARNTLAQVELVAVVVDSTYNRQMPAGMVIKQLPASESVVKVGRQVRLTINSSNMPTLELPALANNSSLREAKAILKQYGFRFGHVEYVDNEELDWVVAVKCQGSYVSTGDRIPRDAAVVLVCGNGNIIETEDTMEIDSDEIDDLDELINQMLNE